jgi:hypothetical protein
VVECTTEQVRYATKQVACTTRQVVRTPKRVACTTTRVVRTTKRVANTTQRVALRARKVASLTEQVVHTTWQVVHATRRRTQPSALPNPREARVFHATRTIFSESPDPSRLPSLRATKEGHLASPGALLCTERTIVVTINNRTLNQASDELLIDGLNKHAATIAFLFIAGQKWLVPDVVKKLQDLVTAATNVRTTRAAWQAAVKADKELRADNLQFAGDVKQTIQAMFSGDIETLAAFGLKARKRKKAKPATKVAAAAKAKATRTARGTKGKKQKAQIHGTSPQEATPATAPAAPTPAVAPAPAAQPKP